MPFKVCDSLHSFQLKLHLGESRLSKHPLSSPRQALILMAQKAFRADDSIHSGLGLFMA